MRCFSSKIPARMNRDVDSPKLVALRRCFNRSKSMRVKASSRLPVVVHGSCFYVMGLPPRIVIKRLAKIITLQLLSCPRS